jgi:hypothetical protein
MNVHNDKVSRHLYPANDLLAELDVAQRQIIAKHEFLVMGYAMAIIILSMGLVFLVILLAVLTFFFPDKGQPFILLLGGPLAAVIALHSKTIVDLLREGYKVAKEGK